MERERSTARRNSAERNWPTLSPTEQSDRAAGGKSGQKNGRSASGTKKKAGEGGGSGQKRAAGEKTGSGQKKATGEKTGSGQKKAAGERSGSGQRKAAGERSGQKKAAGEGSRQLKKAQSQPEVMTIRSGMRGTAYRNSVQEGRNQGYSRATGGQNRAQGHSTAAGGRSRAQGYSAAAGDRNRAQSHSAAAGGRNRAQSHSTVAGGQHRVSSGHPGEDELRRMQNRHTQNRKTSQAKRRHSARRSRHLIYAGMAAVCVLVLFLAAGRIGKRNSAEASGQSDMILAENKKSADGTGLEAANVSDTGEGGTAPSDIPAKSWTNHLPDIGAMYGIYVNQVGWSHFFADNSYCMAPVNQFITAFRATVHNQPEDMTGTIAYRVNLSGSGWLDWVEDAGEGGSSQGAMPLEAVSMKLTGELGENYDVLYSVLQNQQWTDWMKNGEEAGVSGAGLRLDGIRISIVKKNEDGNTYAGNIDPTKPMLALTYDDGPSAHATPRILAALEKYNSRATFFMVGKQAEKRMDVVKKMEELGCEVANHTYDHTLMTKVPPEELASQLARTNQVVSDACGVSPVLMRPCGGARSEAGMNIVGAISMPAVLWSIDTLDWKTRDAQTTIQTVLEQAKDGDIILMHDLYETTADASEVLIPELVNRGFQLVTVSELASYRGGMLPGHTYSRFRPQ